MPSPEAQELIDRIDLSLQWGRAYDSATRAILALRSRLRELDPSLPDVYDREAWSALEQQWTPDVR